MNGFRSVKINGRWDLMLPEYRCFRFLAGDHEKERLASMALNIAPDDRILDIGSEDGDLSCLLSTFASAGLMFLCEAEPLGWAAAKQTFAANSRPDPEFTYSGYVIDQYTPSYPPGQCWQEGWPDFSLAQGEIRGDHPMALDHRHWDEPATESVDGLLVDTLFEPTVINIDIEGAEMLALHGAEKALQQPRRPLVWVSIHPHLIRNYGGFSSGDLINYMERLDYRAIHLADDHEAHWMFEPK